jgi:antirestriction protein ArdC
MSPARQARDLHTAITEQIVAAIERGADDFHMPWHRSPGATTRPWNVVSGKRYQGINVVSLWLAGEAQGYAQPIWGTYRQWQAVGAQVRRGERSSLVVFYKTLERDAPSPDDKESETQRVALARASHVFNAAQVEGYAPPAPSVSAVDRIDPIEAADALLKASGAVIREGGDRAFYSPSDDFIGMPERARFAGSPTMSPTEAYYATLLHELTHWSGAKGRLNRLMPARFGQHAYAMEELVAELGSSYLCADLGVTTALRPDHAAYIQGWLSVMRSDKRAVFLAAARAQDAASYLLQFAPPDLHGELESGFAADEAADPAPVRSDATGARGIDRAPRL